MDFLTKIMTEKKLEVEKMLKEELQPLRKTESFYNRVKSCPQHVHIIGEVKRASPSKGTINESVDILAQAKAYQKAGVSAISVLTDEVFFKGSIEDLRKIAKEVEVPVLCKDFIIAEKQLIRARNAGATIVLLIVAALSQEKLQELYHQAEAIGLEILVEVHDEKELKIAEALGAKLIGVNNRNLKTFVVDIEVSRKLGEKQATESVYISESGLSTGTQVNSLKNDYQAVLVGEALMISGNPEAKVKELQVAR